MSMPVLVLMDYQNGICSVDGVVGRSGLGQQVLERNVLTKVERVLLAFRAQSFPVIHVRVAFDTQYHRMTSSSKRFAAMKDAGLLQDNDHSSQICDQISPIEGEIVVCKGCVNPFIGTNLMQHLVRLQPSEVVMGGVATNHVVESAARHAADSGLVTVVLEDLCASFTQEEHQASVRGNLPFYASILSSEEYLRDNVDSLVDRE